MRVKLIKLSQRLVRKPFPMLSILELTPFNVVSYLFRSLGSVIGLSIGSTLIQTTLRSVLHRTLQGKDVDQVRSQLFDVKDYIITLLFQIIERVRESLDYLKELDPETQRIVRSAYADAVHSNLVFSVSMAVAAMIASWFIVEKSLSR